MVSLIAHRVVVHSSDQGHTVTAELYADARLGGARAETGLLVGCWTEDLAERQPPALLASFDAYSAPQADRWVSVALRTISPALDADASDEAWQCLYEDRVETRRARLRAEPCTVSVTHANTRITWTIRPALFLPLAHRLGAELPSCANEFKPHSTE